MATLVVFAALAIAVAALLPKASRGAGALPALNVAPNEVSVSGLSSGGFMAVQMHVAHAAIMRGAGIVAGGPYGCAEGSPAQALGPCMTGNPDGAAAAHLVGRLARHQRIDDPAHLAVQRVWLFSGRQDPVVVPSVMAQLERFYRQFVPSGQITFRNTLPAGHGFPVLAGDGRCEAPGAGYLAPCGFDGAGELLQHIHGPLQTPEAGPPPGQLLAFDQRQYLPEEGGARSHGLADIGHVFVPATCARGARCRIHVAFHGCRQNVDTAGDAFIAHAGYNRWAAANGIVVLYPQTRATWGLPFNPNGCWDWWGYTGADYATRDAPQIRAVRRMIDRLAAGHPGG